MIASAPSAASAALATGRQRASFSRSRASAERSKARTSCPFFARFAAMPPPILPRPINPTRAMLLPRPLSRPLLDKGGHAFLLVCGAEHAVEQPAFELDAHCETGLEGGVDHFLVRQHCE